MKCTVSIRPATSDDVGLIRGMADVVFRRTYASILSPEQMEYMMDWMYSADSLVHQVSDPGKWFCIAECGGVPAGYVSYELDGSTDDGRPLYHLQKLYVLPEFQGRGIGSALLGHVRSALSASCPGGCRIELNVNRGNPAVGFYEHSGLHRDRSGDFPIGHGYFMNDFIYALDI